MKATLTGKRQITIPLGIRRKLELRQDTVLELDEEADHLTKRVDVARMRSVIGIAKEELAGKSVREWIDDLRGPADLPPNKRR